MGETHDLDHVAAGNGRLWAEDVDPTVNRLSGMMLGLLTDVAGTNDLSAELPLSTGFTSISDGAIFSFVPLNTNVSAMTMQLKTTAGVDVGAAFGLRDYSGVAFAAGAVIAGRLQVFQYRAADGYARRIADASDPTPPATVISGWTLIETQEPTSDTATVTFAATVNNYKSIRIEILAQMNNNAAHAIPQYSPDGSTWRTIGRGQIASQAAGVVMAAFDIHNVDDADGSHLRMVHAVAGGNSNANLDRSSNVGAFTSAGSLLGGYTSYDEDMTYIRVTSSAGNFEGSNSDQRAVFRLWGQS